MSKLEGVEPDVSGFVIKIALNVKSEGLKKSHFPPKGLIILKFLAMKLFSLPIMNMQNFSGLLCWI